MLRRQFDTACGGMVQTRGSAAPGRIGTILTATLVLALAGAPAATAAEPADTTPPTIVDAGLPAGTRVNKVVTLHPIVSDDVAVARVELRVEGRLKGYATAAPWTVTWNSSSVAEADTDLELAALDAAGNRSTTTVGVHVDNYPPVVNFTSSGQHFTGVTPVRFLVSAADTDLARIELLVGTQLIGTTTAAPWTVDWDTAPYDGRTILTLRVYDDLGNVRTGQTVAVADHSGPALTTHFPLVDGYLRAGSSILISAEDDAGIAKVELLANGTVVGATTSGDNGSTLRWDAEAKNGTATMTVRARDGLGNVGEHTRTVVVDNDAPVVTVSPAANAKVRGVFTAAVTSSRDATGVAYFVGGISGSSNLVLRAPWSMKVDTRTTADGPHTFSWDVRDKAGNRTLIRRTLIVDNRAPSVSMTRAPKNKARVKGKVKITAKASDRYGIGRVELLVNGKVVATDRKAAYAFTLNSGKYGTKFTVQLRAYDQAGNVKYSTKRTWRR
jgi:hypothetical protein